jgi:cobalt-zinc-cadmium efflux system outer membrane protein
VIGADLPQRELAADLTKLPDLLDYDEQLARLTATSPEMAAAFAAVSRSEAALMRARKEPVPNVQTQFTLQKDNSTGYTIGGVQVGLPLPLWNRNQGGIMQSEAELSEARRNVNRVEFDLKNRLAVAFQRYAAARSRVQIYTDEIVPKADENFQLVQKAYPAQVSSIEFLIAQRIYFQTKLSYLDALAELWASWNEINGLLLSNSLGSPTDMRR